MSVRGVMSPACPTLHFGQQILFLYQLLQRAQKSVLQYDLSLETLTCSSTLLLYLFYLFLYSSDCSLPKLLRKSLRIISSALTRESHFRSEKHQIPCSVFFSVPIFTCIGSEITSPCLTLYLSHPLHSF